MSKNGYGYNGFNEEGYNIEGFDRDGFDRQGNKISFKNSEEAIAYLIKYRKNILRIFEGFPEEYKKNKDVVLEAISISSRVFETLISEETRNDLEIVATYISNAANPRLKLIPEEQLDKIKNPEEIKEKLLTNRNVAKACVKCGDKDKIPEDILNNVKFIENLTAVHDKSINRRGDEKASNRYFINKIVDRIPKDNAENLIEIYKILPDHVLFEGSDWENNPEFIFKIAEIDIDNYMREELEDYNDYRKRESKKFPKTKEDFRDEAEKRCGVVEFASKELLSNPSFMSEAINRRIDGLDNYKIQEPGWRWGKYEFINKIFSNDDYITDVAVGINFKKVDIEQLPDVLKNARSSPIYWRKKTIKEREEEERNKREVKEVILEQLMKENEDLKARLAKVEALLVMNKDEQAKEEQ